MNEAPPSTPLQGAVHMLQRLGWHRLDPAECLALRGGTRELMLKPRVIARLQSHRFEYRGGSYLLSPGAIDQVLRELSAPKLHDGLLAANERLYAKLLFGITVTEFMPDGRKHRLTVFLVDWTDPAANRFEFCQGMPVLAGHGAHHRAPDIVGYVNGLPLVVIEGARALQEAIGRQLQHQREDELPHLYAHAQLLLAMSPGHARYGTTGTPARFWASWNREEEFDDAQLAAIKGAPAATLDAPDRLLASLLTPRRLLELLRGFVLFDRRMGKIVARHQQFFAVRALLQRLLRKRPDGTREGGVIWHSAGSGKSLTMVFLAKALLLHQELKSCRLVLITDRLDLEAQLARNFMDGGAFGTSALGGAEGERSRATSGRDLARRIGQGQERLCFALLHKFNIAAALPECRNDSPDIVVLVDEGHRSHDGEMHARIRKAMPRAACFAFTGTPLLKEDKTSQRFGPIVHAYTLRAAIDDGAVVPLLYEERVPELRIDDAAVDRGFEQATAGLAPQRRAALKSRHASRGAVHRAPRRIELIAADIATHFDQHFKRTGSGLKGQLATASKIDAIRYKKALDATGLVSSVVVISPPDMREGSAAPEDDHGQAQLQAWWRQNVAGQGRDARGYEREALQAFASDGGPDLLIVVDRLLTGFDEPRNAVLYIDKPLEGHNLIQAVARVNRLHEAKRHGLLVDYRGVLKALDTAMRAYQDLEARTQGGFDIEDLVGLYAPVGGANTPGQTGPPARRGPVDEDAHAPALGRLIDEQVIGVRVREPDARYLVHRLGGADKDAKARARAPAARAPQRASKDIAPAADPLAEAQSFSELLGRAIAQAEAMFERSRGSAARAASDPQARAFFGALLLALGEEEAARLDEAQRSRCVEHALAIHRIVQDAKVEHSLDPQGIESAIRKGLLQLLHEPWGLDRTREVIGHVIRIASIGESRPG